MAVGQGHRSGPGDAIRRQRPRHWCLENPKVFFRDLIESARWHAKILGQNFFRSMSHPIGEQEGLLLGEVAIVKDEQELAALWRQSLDGVRSACRKEPKIAGSNILDIAPALVINGGEACVAAQH